MRKHLYLPCAHVHIYSVNYLVISCSCILLRASTGSMMLIPRLVVPVSVTLATWLATPNLSRIIPHLICSFLLVLKFTNSGSSHLDVLPCLGSSSSPKYHFYHTLLDYLAQRLTRIQLKVSKTALDGKRI